MRTVTPEFLEALRYSHVVAVEAEIEVPGQAPVAVPVVGGHVTLDRTAAVRRRGTLVIPWTLEPAATTGAPVEVRQLPFGSYAVLRRGVQLGEGSRELVTLGRLRVDAASSRVSEGTATLELSDRMAQVADEPLLAPFVPTTGATEAVRELVYGVFGDTIAYHLLTAGGEPTIVDAVYTDDRVKAVHELAATVGAETYFDADGDLVVAPLPAAAAPVWDVDAGMTGVLIDVDESLDRTETVNGVLVVGQASADTAPVSALAVDDTAGSPTLWGGPFGKVAAMLESAAVQTVGQATAQAQAELDRRLTLSRNLTLTAVPNPALEPGDVVHVSFPDGRGEDHLVEALTVSLEPDSTVELASRALDRPTVMRVFHGDDAWRELAA